MSSFPDGNREAEAERSLHMSPVAVQVQPLANQQLRTHTQPEGRRRTRTAAEYNPFPAFDGEKKLFIFAHIYIDIYIICFPQAEIADKMYMFFSLIILFLICQP